MESEIKIEDILFHSLKHHLHYGCKWVCENKGLWNDDIQKSIMSIGASVLDYYTGSLFPDVIANQIDESLQKHNLANKSEYIKWIQSGGGYRLVKLSDNSEWTLRYIKHSQYVHIHPSRNTVNTIRLKSNTLKTVLAVLLFSENTDDNLPFINNIRNKYLNISLLDITKNHCEINDLLLLTKSLIFQL